MGDKDHEGDEDGEHGGDEHHAGGDVFGVLGVEVILVGEEIDHLFYCGVDSFCDEDDHNSEADNHPLEVADIEICAGANDA